MLEELKKLINFIQIEYAEFNAKWKNSSYYRKINLKSNLINSLTENEELLNSIFNYREFINQNSIQLLMDFMQFTNDKVRVNARTKAKNSTEFKIENYIKNHEEGKIPINKCLNDLFGIRIIFTEEITYNEILQFIKENYNDLKCIDSSKQDYKATHIYFKQGNYNFQWELQIWNEKDEMNNIISHEKYKQEYVRWENENKGGSN